MAAEFSARFGKPANALKPRPDTKPVEIGKDLFAALKSVDGADKIISELKADKPFFDFIISAFSLSPFLRQIALVHPQIFADTLCRPFAETIEAIIAQTRQAWRGGDETELMRSLRHAKAQIALTLGLADLGGFMQTGEITQALSRFADAALGAACDFLLLQQHHAGKLVLPDPENPSENSGLIVLGMGKYGAFELNYSSDIDIIVFFDLSRRLELETDDPTSLFVRLARNLNRVLSERSGDGYVFRVDLRLRPDPGSTPLAIPVETAYHYYEAYGQNWERAAFIKARAVAGDIDAGENFLKELTPFIWRKHLDFAAIQDVHSIKRQIHAHKGHGEIAVRGHNVKLGRGGIREIEFFVQTQQLIAGGKRPQLRVTATIKALYALAEDGWISFDAAKGLQNAYWFLRDVEHRLQMIADEQTHILPEDDAGLTQIAFMLGLKDRKQFSERLTATMRQVENHYAALFEQAAELSGADGNLVFTGDDDDPQTLETLTGSGFKQASQIIATIRGWHYGRFAAVRSAQAREILTELTPTLIDAFSQTGEPDQAFFAFDRFLGGLPAGIQLFSILSSNPNLIHLLTNILGSAPRLTKIITANPHIFDALIDPTFAGGLPAQDELSERLEVMLAGAGDYENKLDIARAFAAEHKFLIGVQLLNRTINARQAGLAFSELAEILLKAMLGVVSEEFSKRHGRIAGGRIAILGMGRLGAGELTAGSDLDLIFLYEHDADANASDGEKSLDPGSYFIRLVQRLIAAMSAPTANGVIYELDFRLRPSGNAGPLATQLASFFKYQREEAWTWEKQALTRARFVAGDTELGKKIDDGLAQLLDTDRTNKEAIKNISRDIAKMRKTLDKEKPPQNAFDVKLVKGGLIDIEFIAQWGRLLWPPKNHLADLSTPALIAAMPDEAVNADEREQLVIAYDLYNILLQILRLCLNNDFDPQNADKGLCEILVLQTGLPDMKILESELRQMQKNCRAIFSKLIGG